MKSEREARQLAKTAGLEVVDLRISGGNHIRMVLKRADGETCLSFSPLSPGDVRGRKNKLAELRRFAAGINPKRKH